jgi:predicted HTH domain antitoxin
MKKITLNLPDNIDIDEKEISIMLAAQLYDKGKLALGQSADLVGLSKEEFMNVIGKYGVSVFGETMDDIEKDIQNA